MAEPTRGPSDGTGEGQDEYQTAMRHANEAWTAETENFDNGRDDQRFYAGEQWLPDAVSERTSQNRPIITINRIPGFVRQVTGDIRKDTPSIKIAPARGEASEEVADIFNGLIRNIENKSNTKAAYVQAVENASVTGLGAFRVNTVYSADDSFELDLRIERFTDPFSVLWDPAAKKPDKSDARYVLVFVDVPREEYAKRWPDQPISSMPTGPNGAYGLVWWTMDTVRIAEYWYEKPVKKMLIQLADGRVLDSKEALKEAEGQPLDVVGKRAIETHEVCMRLMNGVEFLTKEVPWPGKYIPIVPVIGEELWVDGRCLRKGMVRDAKDPQRVLNYMRTAAVEAAALQPKMPWVLTVDMVKGLEGMWGQAGSKNLPYIVYNPDPRAPGGAPKRAEPALAQAGLDSQGQIAGEDIQSVVGIYNVSLGAQSNETSGRAINARNKQADTGSFHYVDNLATAIRHMGDILVDLIPKVYDTARVVRVLKEDGDQKMVQVNAPSGEVDETGGMKLFNDLSVGEYEVTVITGPSFATKRQEAAEGMQMLFQSVPALAQVAGDLYVKALDIPYANEIAKRIERTLPPNVTSDEPMPPPPPDPAVVAKTLKDAASVDLLAAQTEGQQLENVGQGLTLFQAVTALGAQLQGLQGQISQLAQAGAPMKPGEPQAAPPVQPQLAPSGPAPMVANPQAMQDMSAMGELEPMPDQGQPPA